MSLLSSKNVFIEPVVPWLGDQIRAFIIILVVV